MTEKSESAKTALFFRFQMFAKITTLCKNTLRRIDKPTKYLPTVRRIWVPKYDADDFIFELKSRQTCR
jgi:hypothetical protein